MDKWGPETYRMHLLVTFLKANRKCKKEKMGHWRKVPVKLPQGAIFRENYILTPTQKHIHHRAVLSTAESGLLQNRLGQFVFGQYDGRNMGEKYGHGVTVFLAKFGYNFVTPDFRAAKI